VPRIAQYTKKDGTEVRAHDRWAPGARTQLASLIVVGMVVVGAGNGQVKIEKVGSGESGADRPRVSAPAAGAHR
jgi:hypothetical protein